MGKGIGGDDYELGGDGWRLGEVTWVTSLPGLHGPVGDLKVNCEFADSWSFKIASIGSIGVMGFKSRTSTEKSLPFVYSFFTEIGV